MVGTAHCARISIGWTYLNAPIQAENVFYLQDASDSIFTNPLATCTAIATVVGAQLVPSAGVEVLYNGVTFEDVRTVPFGGISLGIGPLAGSNAGSGHALPTDVCIAVKKSTASIGRSGRGRWFHPVGNTGHLATPDTVTAGFITNLLTRLSNFQTGVEAIAGTPKMGIVSYHTGGSARTAGLFQQITGWSVTDAFVDSQRRRLLGRGR